MNFSNFIEKVDVAGKLVAYGAIGLASAFGSAVMLDNLAYEYGFTSERTISEILPEGAKNPPYNTAPAPRK